MPSLQLRRSARFARHIAPLKRPACWSDEMRRSAVLLSYRIGCNRAAYLFSVHANTIHAWRGRIRL
jgi:transposase-like protein